MCKEYLTASKLVYLDGCMMMTGILWRGAVRDEMSLVSDKAEDDVVANLQGVNVKEALGGGDKGKVDSMGDRPKLPTGADANPSIFLNLVDDVVN